MLVFGNKVMSLYSKHFICPGLICLLHCMILVICNLTACRIEPLLRYWETARRVWTFLEIRVWTFSFQKSLLVDIFELFPCLAGTFVKMSPMLR